MKNSTILYLGSRHLLTIAVLKNTWHRVFHKTNNWQLIVRNLLKSSFLKKKSNIGNKQLYMLNRISLRQE